MRYKLTNHTADIGIRLSNKTLKGVFEDAAFALFDILCDIKKVRADFKRIISVEAVNGEELLNLFLSVLLKEFTSDNNLLNKVEIEEIKEGAGVATLSAIISGEPYDPARHSIKTEIKAVTFHNLSIKKTKGGYTAEVIFDV
ncbi:MAG TPA: archease [Planctomycetota bacterium]|nr:archease [Planctomycetota bacterium]